MCHVSTKYRRKVGTFGGLVKKDFPTPTPWLLPVALKRCHPHPLYAGLSVGLGDDRHLPQAAQLGGVPQHHLRLAVPVPSHTTQHRAGAGEAARDGREGGGGKQRTDGQKQHNGPRVSFHTSVCVGLGGGSGIEPSTLPLPPPTHAPLLGTLPVLTPAETGPHSGQCRTPGTRK